ncbi:MAG: hypothetical protein IKA46_04065 [Clostridia bacterium]|nr:hypothetical protein [Clostridia bacterium]MBR7111593.1 hypothetical protein [Clostridia bacterium]
MTITDQIVSISKADQNSHEACEQAPTVEMTDDEKIDLVAAHILEKYRAAFEELAK